MSKRNAGFSLLILLGVVFLVCIYAMGGWQGIEAIIGVLTFASLTVYGVCLLFSE